MSDLGEARNEASETSAAESALRGRVATLESELAAAQNHLDEARSEAEQAQAPRESQLRALEAVSECDLAPMRRELMSTRSREIDAKSQLSSAVSVVQTEGGSTLSDRGEQVAVPAAAAVEPAMGATTARPAEAEAPSPPAVTLEEVRAAVLPDAADRLVLARALSDIASQDAAVRADAARAMAGVRHEFSVRALVAQLTREPSPEVQQGCIKALVNLEMKEGLPAIERVLTDRSASVRLAAVWGLYHLGGAESASALARVLSDEDEEVRRRAATCIGWLGREELAAQLLPLLDDSSVSIRRAAVEAMGSLRSRQVVSALIERLNDPEESIRRAVFTAIEAIAGKKMSESFPKDEKSLQLLIARWRVWWKDEHPG